MAGNTSDNHPMKPFDVIRYGFLEKTIIGDILVAATSRGVCHVSFGRKSKEEKLSGLTMMVGDRMEIVRDIEAVRPYIENLVAYLDGSEGEFNVPVDLDTFCTPFQKKLYTSLMKVKNGQTITYGELASRIGMPGGSRAVGGGMGRNPIPIFVPCHRVIAAQGKLGGFSGGIDLKKILLRLEGTFD